MNLISGRYPFNVHIKRLDLSVTKFKQSVPALENSVNRLVHCTLNCLFPEVYPYIVAFCCYCRFFESIERQRGIIYSKISYCRPIYFIFNRDTIFIDGNFLPY
jgi:hypothetical protein